MSITLVGSKTFTYSTSGGGDVISLTDLGTLQQNDLVIIAISNGGSTNNTASMGISGYTSIASAYGNGSGNDVSTVVQRKLMGSTPDTSFTTPTLAGSRFTGTVHVLRGVNTTTILDVSATTATGASTDLGDPPSITPVTGGSWIIAYYSAGQKVQTSWNTPAGFNGYIQNGTDKVRIAAAYKNNWTSGAFDPPALTTGDGDSSNAWAGITIAIRSGITTYDIDATLNTAATASVNPVLINLAAASFTASATISANLVLTTHQGAATLSGTATLTAPAKVLLLAASSLSGLATTTLDATINTALKTFAYVKPQTGANTYSVGVVVKKDTIAKTTRNGLLRVSGTGGTPKVADIQFDTSNGTSSTASNNNWVESGVYDCGEDWLVWGTFLTNSNNTQLQVEFSPCGGINFTVNSAATGVMYFKEPLIVEGDKYKLGRDILLASFNMYTDAIVALDQAISVEDAKTAVWGSVSSTPANLLTLTGSEVLDNAAILASIANDDVISISEKYDLARLYTDLEGRYNDTYSRATTLALSTTALTTARTNFVNLLNSYSPQWNNTASDTTIFTSAFADKNFITGWTTTNVSTAASGIYYTITDSDGTNAGNINRSRSQAAAATTYSFAWSIKKDSTGAATRTVRVEMTTSGGTSKTGGFNIDTQTGATGGATNLSVSGVLNLGEAWLAYGTFVTNADNTGVVLKLYPAFNATLSSSTALGSKTGSADVRAPLLTVGAATALGHHYLNGITNAYAAAITNLWSSISSFDALTSIIISGASTTTIYSDSTGAINSGQLPRNIQFYANAGNVSYTTNASGTWSYTASPSGSVSGTIGANTGTLNLTALSAATSTLTISFAYGGVTRTFTHIVNRSDAPPTSTGGGSSGGGTSSTTVLGATTGTTYDLTNSVSNVLTCAAGAAGEVICSAPITFNLTTSTAGSGGALGKWQYRTLPGGSFTDFGSEGTSSYPAVIAPDPEAGGLVAEDGYISVNATKTGLTNGTSYEFRFLWKASTSRNVRRSSGTITATGN